MRAKRFEKHCISSHPKQKRSFLNDEGIERRRHQAMHCDAWAKVQSKTKERERERERERAQNERERESTLRIYYVQQLRKKSNKPLNCYYLRKNKKSEFIISRHIPHVFHCLLPRLDSPTQKVKEEHINTSFSVSLPTTNKDYSTVQ